MVWAKWKLKHTFQKIYNIYSLISMLKNHPNFFWNAKNPRAIRILNDIRSSLFEPNICLSYGHKLVIFCLYDDYFLNKLLVVLDPRKSSTYRWRGLSHWCTGLLLFFVILSQFVYLFHHIHRWQICINFVKRMHNIYWFLLIHWQLTFLWWNILSGWGSNNVQHT